VDEKNYEFLHDLKNDPDELINLASNPKYTKTLKEMRGLTDQRVKELGGPLSPMKGPLSKVHGSISGFCCQGSQSPRGRWFCQSDCSGKPNTKLVRGFKILVEERWSTHWPNGWHIKDESIYNMESGYGPKF
jgi:hypothetical protein